MLTDEERPFSSTAGQTRGICRFFRFSARVVLTSDLTWAFRLADRPLRGADKAGPAFATPTVVHFAVVLFLSAISRAPWPETAPLASLWGLMGVGGAMYTGIVVRRMRSQSAYQPGFEDWSFHAVLPFTAYALLGITALRATSHARGALFGVGAAGLGATVAVQRHSQRMGCRRLP